MPRTTYTAELEKALTVQELLNENARLSRNLRQAVEDNRRLREVLTVKQQERVYLREQQ